MSHYIKGYATAEATLSFAEASVEKGLIVPNHFRKEAQGLSLSSMGIGTYLGNPDEETNQRVFESLVSAVSSGAINIIDTAINYRYQLAERCVGKAVKELIEEGLAQRDELFIASKIGYLTPDGDVDQDFITYFREQYIESELITQEDVIGGVHCMTPNYLNDQLERSRRNLGLETIDLMYLHNAAESEMPQLGPGRFMDHLISAFEFLEAAREEGRIRYYGMASWNCFMANAQKSPIYVSLQDVVELAKEVGGE
jgi:aryl-alcohol dehydrogenase-like predicted oxidoreductase